MLPPGIDPKRILGPGSIHAARQVQFQLEPVQHGQIQVVLVPVDQALRGRVLAADTGQPVANLPIHLGEHARPVPLQTTAWTDAQGRFHRESVGPDVWSLQVDDPEQLLVPNLVRLTPEVATAADTYRLVRTLSVTGQVANTESDEGLGACRLIFQSGRLEEGTAWTRTTRTNAAGHFRLRLPPGKARVTIRAHRDYATTTRPLEIPSAEPAVPLRFYLRCGPVLHGRALAATGQPVAGVSACFLFGNGQTYADTEAWTDPAGRFTLPRPTGSLRLELVLLQRERRLGARLLPAAEAGVKATAPLEIPLQPLATLHGRVLAVADQPVSGAEVQLLDRFRLHKVARTSVEHLVAVRTTDAAGRYAFTEVLPGAEHHFRVTARKAGAALVVSPEVEVAADQKQQLPDLHLRVPTATVAGIVVDAQGQPVADAEVRLATPLELPRAQQARLVKPARTGLDGRFVLRELSPGPWEVEVTLMAALLRTRRGEPPASQRFTLQAGQQDVRLIVTPAPTK